MIIGVEEGDGDGLPSVWSKTPQELTGASKVGFLAWKAKLSGDRRFLAPYTPCYRCGVEIPVVQSIALD